MVGVRTRSPARMQRASRSIVSLRLKILSSIRASEISSSLCLHIAIGMRKWKGSEKVSAQYGDAYSNAPAGFVFCRCHRREFAVDSDHTLKRPLRLRTHHFRVHLRQHATYVGGKRDTSRFSGEPRARGTLPCFAQGTLDVAELGAKGKRVRARLEEFAAVEAEGLVESGEEKVFPWY